MKKKPCISIMSGKGGTGKTTVSVNLSIAAERQGIMSCLLDCDVEEPNSHLFFETNAEENNEVLVSFPVIQEEKCSHCGACGKFCNFNAILNTKKKNIILAELCHDCGGCAMVCPTGALEFNTRTLGEIRKPQHKLLAAHYYGLLHTGEYSGVKIIEAMKKIQTESDLVFRDAPPGTGCASAAAAEGADFVCIVTEPGLFGLHDMQMLVEMLRHMNIPFGVFINKDYQNEDFIRPYCSRERIPVLGSLPFSMEYGNMNAEGKILIDQSEEASDIFKDLALKLGDMINEYS